MTLNEYQQEAMATCMPTCDNIVYMGFNLSAEVGELMGKIAKAIRHDTLRISNSSKHASNTNLVIDSHRISEEQMNEIKKECGDIAWMLAGVCDVLGFDLEGVCQQNLDKLASRKRRGVIDGNGDNR